MALSIGIETLLGIPFRLRPLWKIAVVNLITQILLAALLLCSPGIIYYTALFMGEIVVYLAEFIAYLSFSAGNPAAGSQPIPWQRTPLRWRLGWQ